MGLINMYFRYDSYYNFDEIEINLNGQRFIEKFALSIDNSKDKDLLREKAKLIGESLKSIGDSIIHQATYGKPCTIIHGDGLKRIYF